MEYNKENLDGWAIPREAFEWIYENLPHGSTILELGSGNGTKELVKYYNDAFNGEKLTEENYKEVFENHKNTVIDMVKKSNSELLIYNFEEGWGPFCNFLNKEVPNKDIPWVNKGTMFDKI
jgi:hypothetical protein